MGKSCKHQRGVGDSVPATKTPLASDG